MSNEEFERYNFRKAAGKYFGVSTDTIEIITEVKIAPTPKKKNIDKSLRRHWKAAVKIGKESRKLWVKVSRRLSHRINSKTPMNLILEYLDKQFIGINTACSLS